MAKSNSNIHLLNNEHFLMKISLDLSISEPIEANIVKLAQITSGEVRNKSLTDSLLGAAFRTPFPQFSLHY